MYKEAVFEKTSLRVLFLSFFKRLGFWVTCTPICYPCFVFVALIAQLSILDFCMLVIKLFAFRKLKTLKVISAREVLIAQFSCFSRKTVKIILVPLVLSMVNRDD